MPVLWGAVHAKGLRAMPERRLTVVQLLPALNAGGVERSVLEIGRALVAAGHRSIVVSGGGRLQEKLTAQGSEHIDLDIGRKSLATLRHIRTLRRQRFATDVQVDMFA